MLLSISFYCPWPFYTFSFTTVRCICLPAIIFDVNQWKVCKLSE